MKKITKAFLAALCTASLFGVVACTEEPAEQPEQPGTNDQEQQQPEEKQPVAKFEGAVAISGTDYNVVLNLYEDGTLKLVPGNGAAEKTGTYVFVEGEGYTLTIAGQELKTKWNATATAHEFDYELKLGEAGSGTVKLALVDSDFVLTAKTAIQEFIDNAVFVGSFEFRGTYGLQLKFNEDGTYAITTDSDSSFVKPMLEKTGAYTYANNAFTVTIDGTEYTSVYNPVYGSYSLTYTINGADASFPVTLTYQPELVLTGSVQDFGGITFDLYLHSDGKCTADVTCTASIPGVDMNAMYDKTGTWTKDAEGNFVVVIGEKTFTSSINTETGLINIPYSIQGERLIEATLAGSGLVLTGLVDAMGGIQFDMKFISADTVFIDITSLAAASMNKAFDHNGTYTVNGGVITVTAKDKTYTSTFNAETGAYSIVYEFAGQDGVFTPDLTATIWK